MKKCQVNGFEKGTPEYVIAHAMYKKSRGKKPSMMYKDEKNPRMALALASLEIANAKKAECQAIISPASESRRNFIGSKEKMSDFQLYLAIRRIADMAYDYATPEPASDDREKPWLNDRRDGGINPFYSQTENGIFLELYYGIPGKIWTPWGYYDCWGSGSGCWGEKMDRFLERLGATVFREKAVSSMGEFGPIYALHRVDELILPPPEARQSSNKLSYDQARSEWAELTKKYHELRNEQAPMSYEQRHALDQIILETRGKHEPRPTRDDITSLEELELYRGKAIKYTKDGGKTWLFCKIYPSEACDFSDGSFGYPMDAEVLPNVGTHWRGSITNKHFKNGMVARPAIDDELKTIAFSYDSAGR